jgi:hypothetical protein
MREGNSYFDGGKVILCMNNIFQMKEREEMNLWRDFIMSANKLPRGSRKLESDISFD